jgi:hypothetical protein
MWPLLPAEADAIGMATHLQPFSLRNRVSLTPLPTVPKRWNINKMTWQSAVVDDQIDVQMNTISLQSAVVDRESRRPIMQGSCSGITGITGHLVEGVDHWVGQEQGASCQGLTTLICARRVDRLCILGWARNKVHRARGSPHQSMLFRPRHDRSTVTLATWLGGI